MCLVLVRKELVIMKTQKNKHMSLTDRLHIQELLDQGELFSKIARVINKDRTTVYREVFNHRYLREGDKKEEECLKLKKAPYVCNGCEHRNSCRKDRFFYEAYIAQNDYQFVRRDSRKTIHITKSQIADINEKIAPLMIEKHHSVNQMYINHKEYLPFSKVTFYKYVDSGILNVRNIDLTRKVRYKTRKEKSDIVPKMDPKMKLGRFYEDFKDYIAFNYEASVVEIDTVIGTSGGKGGKCFLTLYFRSSKLMLIYLLPYKKAIYVNQVFDNLKKVLGKEAFQKLFEVILTDNGTEFSDPEYLEQYEGEKIIKLFYCDPNSSWQKGGIEKNHEYIRYVLPKGTSFAGLSQEDSDLLASHINSVPRPSLYGLTPYEASLPIIGKEILDKLHISRIEKDDVNLSPKLLKKNK